MHREAVTDRKRGNSLGFWFFTFSLRVFGLSGAYGLLYPVSLYYLLFDRTVVAASMAYVKRRFKHHNFLQRIFDVYRLFVSQGKNLIDRFAAVAGGGDFDVEVLGYERVMNILANSERGIILLTAHIGNWQLVMPSLKKLEKTVYLLMRPEDNLAVKRALKIGDGSDAVRIISSEDFLGGVLESMKALNEGSIVSIMGDRTYGHNSTAVAFLGEKVDFPSGAFSIAAAAGCPVVVLLSAKVGKRKYVLDLTNVIEPRYRSREKKREHLQTSVQTFASVLEEYVNRYPFQWFVFRDIWQGNA